MGLQKQSVDLTFAGGLDTLSDSYNLSFGKFVSLQNSVFIQTDGRGRLNKRFGYPQIGTLPDGSTIALTTFNGGLIAIGNNIKAYADGAKTWSIPVDYIPVELSTVPLTNSSLNQVQIDTAISTNGLVCATLANGLGNALVAALNQVPTYGYSILDKDSGNTIVPFTFIPAAIFYPFSPKTFYCGKYFFVVFGDSTNNLRYFTVDSTAPNSVSTIGTVSTAYSPNNISSMSSFDGTVASNTLFIAWASNDKKSTFATSINSASVQGATVTICSTGSIISVCADVTQSPPTIWTSTWTVGTDTGRIVATNFALTPLFTQRTFTSTSIAYMTSVAQNGVATVFTDIPRLYAGQLGSVSDYIQSFTVPQSTSSITNSQVVVRSLGLASKAFIVNSATYFMGVYQSQNQSTYFVVASSGLQVAKLAYGNAPGYTTGTLGNANVIGSSVSIGYLYTNTVTTANTGTTAGVANTPAVVTSTGTALVNLDFNPNNVAVVEAGNNLNLSGGFLWAYDGSQATEQNFHLYPEPIGVSAVASTGGLFTKQTYFYKVIYEAKDYRGNIFRSAPSIPVSITIGSDTGSINLEVPRIRVTNRLSVSTFPINIKTYRWASDQQTYYLLPVNTTNNKGIDSQTIIDQYPTSAEILGNELLYTTGGVAEDTASPATNSLAFFDDRLWLIDSEDGTLWFSKQVVSGTAVELSQVFTYFVAPSSVDLGLSGRPRAIAPMDDKLIIFKSNSIYYINGSGPDNTGASNQYSPTPVFITGGVGCSNPNSIVLTPQGLMFQSNKGIWLLGRDMSVKYVGEGVQAFNTCQVKSALVVPGTNEVRFTLGSSGQTLVYDYLVGQWDQYTGIQGTSATIYQNQHTYLSGQNIYQQSSSSYVDGTTPTVMNFTTGWVNLASLAGYIRAYRMYLLGKFSSAHAVQIGIAYDYNPTIVQVVNFTPTNVVGSGSQVEEWQINFQQQQCQSFQLTFQEVASATAGAGLYISGISFVAGVKKDFPRNIANRTG